jgi:hypothetical protein
VAIDDGTWRSVLSGGAAGSVTVGNGRRFDQPGGGPAAEGGIAARSATRKPWAAMHNAP